MKMLVPKGAQSLAVDVVIIDTSSAQGEGLTGLVYNTSGLQAYYHRNTAASPTQITLANASVGTWSSGGFKEVDATNMPGVYQLGIPNAALADGADSVVIDLLGAVNMLETRLEIQLTDQVYQAKIWFTDDNAGAADLYSARWYVDDQPVMSGISDPTIQVVDWDDVDKIAESSMVTGSTGLLKYPASGAERLANGEHYEIIVRAVINGAERIFTQQISRDS